MTQDPVRKTRFLTSGESIVANGIPIEGQASENVKVRTVGELQGLGGEQHLSGNRRMAL